MDKRIEEIINSGLIEEYLFGTLDKAESQRVEQLVADHPELHQHMLELQEVLWGMADEMAIDPPPSVKAKIMAEMEAGAVKGKPTNSTGKWKGWAAAAIIAMGALASGVVLTSNHAQEVRGLQTAIQQCQKEQGQSIAAADYYKDLLSPTTAIQVLKSDNKELEIIAFANKSKQTLAMDLRQLPVVPRGKCLQLWGDKNGEMISIAVLDYNEDYMQNPLTIDAAFASINVTIEEAGPDGTGSDHATVSALLASASI